MVVMLSFDADNLTYLMLVNQGRDICPHLLGELITVICLVILFIPVILLLVTKTGSGLALLTVLKFEF